MGKKKGSKGNRDSNDMWIQLFEVKKNKNKKKEYVKKWGF
jgi:hypothetical protein